MFLFQIPSKCTTPIFLFVLIEHFTFDIVKVPNFVDIKKVDYFATLACQVHKHCCHVHYYVIGRFKLRQFYRK